MHIRQQIREAFVNAVELTSVGLTVFNGRIFPLYDEKLPAANVYTRSESIDDEAGRKFHQQSHNLTATIQINTKAVEFVENDLDSISIEVEQKIFESNELKNLIRCLDLISVEMEVSPEGEQQIAVLTMQFSCKYMTVDGSPEAIQ